MTDLPFLSKQESKEFILSQKKFKIVVFQKENRLMAGLTNTVFRFFDGAIIKAYRNLFTNAIHTNGKKDRAKKLDREKNILTLSAAEMRELSGVPDELLRQNGLISSNRKGVKIILLNSSLLASLMKFYLSDFSFDFEAPIFVGSNSDYLKSTWLSGGKETWQLIQASTKTLRMFCPNPKRKEIDCFISFLEKIQERDCKKIKIG